MTIIHVLLQTTTTFGVSGNDNKVEPLSLVGVETEYSALDGSSVTLIAPHPFHWLVLSHVLFSAGTFLSTPWANPVDCVASTKVAASSLVPSV